MRWIVAILVLGLAGCGMTPQQLGITGPGHAVLPPEPPSDATLQVPGVPATGSSNAGQRYFGYN
jgi:hypothetical protein